MLDVEYVLKYDKIRKKIVEDNNQVYRSTGADACIIAATLAVAAIKEENADRRAVEIEKLVAGFLKTQTLATQSIIGNGKKW